MLVWVRLAHTPPNFTLRTPPRWEYSHRLCTVWLTRLTITIQSVPKSNLCHHTLPRAGLCSAILRGRKLASPHHTLPVHADQGLGFSAVAAMATHKEADLTLPEGGLEIDGGMLEGGGQILRNAAALAAILGRPIRVSNIRANRSKPGLRPQHLAGVELVARIATAELHGASVGSTTIVLKPGTLFGGNHRADTGTAGSCALLAQAALPCLVLAPGAQGSSDQTAAASMVELRGGTDASMAPPVGYMHHVLFPMLRHLFAIEADVQLFKRGFFPRGGGSMQLLVQSLSGQPRWKGINLSEQPQITCITIRAFTAGQIPEKVGQRMVQSARKVIRAELGSNVKIVQDIQQESEQTAVGNGCGILLTATGDSDWPILGAAGLGERGVSAESVGEKAASELTEDILSGACVDRWLQDQLIIFLALAAGSSRMTCSEPTLHTRTAMVIAEQFTDSKFKILQPDSKQKAWTIQCEAAAS